MLGRTVFQDVQLSRPQEMLSRAQMVYGRAQLDNGGIAFYIF